MPDTPTVTFKIMMNDSTDKMKGYGYDILMNGVRYIHQQTIPAVNGNQYFQMEEDAVKVASLVCFKIQHQVMPPTVTVHELDSLGVTVNKMQ